MENKFKITAVKGDLLERYFVLELVDVQAVEEMCFTCVGQGICVHLPYSDAQGGWCLRLGSEITAQFRSRICKYDLTATLIDGNDLTIIKDGVFTVRDKNNKLCEE